LLAERIKTKAIAWQKAKTKMIKTQNKMLLMARCQVNNQVLNSLNSVGAEA